MKKTGFIIIITLALLQSACEKLVLGSDEANDPEHIFEMVWEDFDQHYALFEVKNINWDSLYAIHRPRVNPNTTDDELWDILTELLLPFDDEHVKLRYPDEEKVFSTGEHKNLHAIDELDLVLIDDKYLVEFNYIADYFGFGIIEDHNIGYIHLTAMLGVDGKVIYEVLERFGNVDAIIVDVRNNIGGNDSYARDFSGGFSDGKHFLYTVETRNGPKYSDFDSPNKIYSLSESENNFVKPVVLLTDEFTVSGGEIFTLNMKAFEHVTHIGDTTAGAHSDVGPTRFLPNGWTYEYSIQKYLMPDGKSLEGIGIAPDFYIQNTKEEIENGQDKVLEYAIHYLEDIIQ